MEDISDSRTEDAIWTQKELYVLQILFHLVWEFPLSPMYATPPAAPVAAATIPNSSYTIPIDYFTNNIQFCTFKINSDYILDK